MCLFKHFRIDSTSSTVKSINLGKAATIHTKVSKNNSLAFFPTPITELKIDIIGRTHKSQKRKTLTKEKKIICISFKHNFSVH